MINKHKKRNVILDFNKEKIVNLLQDEYELFYINNAFTSYENDMLGGVLEYLIVKCVTSHTNLTELLEEVQGSSESLLKEVRRFIYEDLTLILPSMFLDKLNKTRLQTKLLKKLSYYVLPKQVISEVIRRSIVNDDGVELIIFPNLEINFID